jgi:DNA-binding transcriptional regulator/RsmH inhibitor MraZ
MRLQINDDVFKRGPYWGRYEPKIDDTSRLRLSKEIVNTLRQHRVVRLWRCPDPTGERFILCAPKHRLRFLKTVKAHLAESERAEDAFRLLCSGTDAAIDSQGRIKIPRACLERAKISPPAESHRAGRGLMV